MQALISRALLPWLITLSARVLRRIRSILFLRSWIKSLFRTRLLEGRPVDDSGYHFLNGWNQHTVTFNQPLFQQGTQLAAGLFTGGQNELFQRILDCHIE